MKRALLIGILLLTSFSTPRSAPDSSDEPTPIEIKATPIQHFELKDLSRRRFGALEFRGGLILSSPYERFGGLSAIHVAPDGEHFVAVSDRTLWLRGRIVYSAAGRPSAIADAVMAPVLDTEGKPAKRWDTESIAENDGWLYVGIEGRDNIMRFDYGRKGLLALAEPVATPEGVKDLPGNRGLEAIVCVPKQFPLAGTLIGFSEGGQDAAGNLKAFLIGGPTPGTFSVKRTKDYDISDATLLPDGDILILDRHFSMVRGISIRIRRIRLADVKPGAFVDGPPLIEADMRYEIDNMEGLAIHRTASGETVLTMLSDDNFSPLQRTLLLQFTVR